MRYARQAAFVVLCAVLTRSRRTITYAVLADVHGSLAGRVRFAITYRPTHIG